MHVEAAGAIKGGRLGARRGLSWGREDCERGVGIWCVWPVNELGAWGCVQGGPVSTFGGWGMGMFAVQTYACAHFL